MNKLIPTETAKFFQSHHIDEVFHEGMVIKDGHALPLEIEISIIDACTRKCFCCPRGNDEIAPNTPLKLTEELWTKFSDELKEARYKGLIMLSGFGECLMHPRLLEIVKAFNFTSVNVNTNGDLLTADIIKKLKEAGLQKLMISVYEEKRMPYFQELAKEHENFVIIRNRYENFDRLFNNRGGAVYKHEHVDNICFYPFYMMMVDCNGDVFPCCHEWQRKLKMGNLYQQSFWEIWTSPAYKKVREKILEGNRDLYPCRICNVNGTYRGKQNFDYYVEREHGTNG